MPKVLITNAEYGHTVSIIRSLAMEKDIEIVAAGWHKLAPARYSRYVKKSYYYTWPLENQEQFILDIIEIIKKEKPDVLLPIGIDTTLTISKHKERLRGLVKIPIADYSQMAVVHNKLETLKLAQEAGVPYPKTILADSDNLESRLDELKMPVIIKAKLGSGEFAKAYSKQEVFEKIREIENSRSSKGVVEVKNPLIQEFIPGQIHDACVLFNQGKLRAALTQERVLTIPAEGGPGILNETHYKPELIEYSKKMLEKINYHGPAQIEFIIDERDNQPKLLEINPKFWGTSATAIAAGMNFPLLAFKMAMEGDIEPVLNYKVGVKHKLPIPNLIEYFIQSKSIKKTLQLLNCFGQNNHCNLSLKDPLPDLILISRMFAEAIMPKALIKKIRGK